MCCNTYKEYILSYSITRTVFLPRHHEWIVENRVKLLPVQSSLFLAFSLPFYIITIVFHARFVGILCKTLHFQRFQHFLYRLSDMIIIHC